MSKNRQPIIGVVGPGNPENRSILNQAEEIGSQIANRDWTLLTGGRNAGVMDAASKGAYEAGGDVLGILPGDPHMGMSDFVTTPIISGMGSARNVINVLTADVIIVCGMGLGTSSEAALSIKYEKPTLFTKIEKTHLDFFQSLTDRNLHSFDDSDELLGFIEKNLLPK